MTARLQEMTIGIALYQTIRNTNRRAEGRPRSQPAERRNVSALTAAALVHFLTTP